MAEDKKLLLANELTLGDGFALGQIMGTPGFEVLRRLYEAACAEAGADTLRLDPERTDYNHVLGVRTQRARNFNELVEWVRTSALMHHNRVRKAAADEYAEVKEKVTNVFGIHPAKPGVKNDDAIKNVFGIHPAKPKKANPKGKATESNAAKENI